MLPKYKVGQTKEDGVFLGLAADSGPVGIG